MATAGGSTGWSRGRRSNGREESDAGAAAATIGGGGAWRAAAMARSLAPLRLLLAREECEMGGTRSGRAVWSTWRRGEAVGPRRATRTPATGRGFHAAAAA
jgi:hypothetical protein